MKILERFGGSASSFAEGLWHLIPTVALIYDNKQKTVAVELTFLKWDASGSVKIGSMK